MCGKRLNPAGKQYVSHENKMSTWIVLFTCVALVILWPGYQHELHRWERCYMECQKQHDENVRLLEQDICKNPWSGQKARSICDAAERENQSTPLKCAWTVFWQRGELYALYSSFTKNNWMLLGLTLPVLLLIVYMLFTSSNQRYQEKIKMQERKEWRKDMLKLTSQMQQHQQPSYYNETLEYKSPKKRRKKRRREKEIKLISFAN